MRWAETSVDNLAGLTAACWAAHSVARTVEQMVELKVVSMAAPRVENSAGLKAECWAVCSVGHSAASMVESLVTQWAEN